MPIDRSRILKLIISSKRIDVVTLNPSDSDQNRQAVIRKMVADIIKSSNQRSVLVVSVEM